jgi:hypothetical protein
MSINFWIVLLEWYEFSVYNALIPYNIFGGKADFVYYGFALSALSFLARPAGAIYFGGISDKTSGLRLGLLLMCTSTVLMALCPNIEALKPFWFGVCKIMHGFAIGGSYGTAYLSIYNKEEEKHRSKVNYRLAGIQTGWVYGMLMGEFTVLILKMLVGNLNYTINMLKSIFSIDATINDYKIFFSMKPAPAFSQWGWRVAFGISALFGIFLYLRTNKIKTNKQPVENITIKVINYIKKNPYKFLCVFAVASIDMILFHSWFTYHEVVQGIENSALSLSVISNIRKTMLIVLFPVFGLITDQLNQILGKYRGNFIMLSGVCAMVTMFSLIKVPTIFWVLISTITAAMCYGSIVAWVMRKLGKSADFMAGPVFNLSGAIIGGTIPLLAATLSTNFGPAAAQWLTVGLITTSFLALVVSGS